MTQRKFTPAEIATLAVPGLKTHLDVPPNAPPIRYGDECGIKSTNPAGGYVDPKKFSKRGAA
jgi:hypothetical protein